MVPSQKHTAQFSFRFFLPPKLPAFGKLPARFSPTTSPTFLPPSFVVSDVPSAQIPYPPRSIGRLGALAFSTSQNMDPSKDDSPKHSPPSVAALGTCLLTLYRKYDGLDKPQKRPTSFRSNALRHYDGDANFNGTDKVWCHVTDAWSRPKDVKAAHVVPFFLDSDDLGEILFGSRTQSLRRAGNSLLLLDQIEQWFASYHLVIVPADAKETPITRWKVNVLSSDIHNTLYGQTEGVGRDLEGKELKFRNEKRPVCRFMYFHFIMALIRIKDDARPGWQDLWARYYQQRPFPTTGNYMRKSMLRALATHFGTAQMEVLESWITDHGFDSPLVLNEDESTEAARRVHLAVLKSIDRAERGQEDNSEGEKGESSEGEADNEDDEE